MDKDLLAAVGLVGANISRFLAGFDCDNDNGTAEAAVGSGIHIARDYFIVYRPEWMRHGRCACGKCDFSARGPWFIVKGTLRAGESWLRENSGINLLGYPWASDAIAAISAEIEFQRVAAATR